jgi:hypothetical protein
LLALPLIVLVVAVGVSVLSARMPAPPPTDLEVSTMNAAYQAHLANARDYQAQRQLDLALEEVRQALAIQPNGDAALRLQRELAPPATVAVRTMVAEATVAARPLVQELTAVAAVQGTAEAQAERFATAEARAAEVVARYTPTATLTKRLADATARVAGYYPCADGEVKGARSTRRYWVPTQRDYRFNTVNIQCFPTEEEAQAAGFRRALP